MNEEDPPEERREPRAAYESAASRIAKLRGAVAGRAPPQSDAPTEAQPRAPSNDEPADGPPPAQTAAASDAQRALPPPTPPAEEAAQAPQTPPPPAAGSRASGQSDTPAAAAASASRAVVPVDPRAAAQQAPPDPLPPRKAPASKPKAAAPAGRRPGSPTAAKRRRRRPQRMSPSRAAILSMTSQEAPLTEVEDEWDVLRFSRTAVMRVFAVTWLALTVFVWGRLVGAFPAGLTLAWHAPEGPMISLVLGAIIAPVVAIGLWLAASWGIVLWAAALLTWSAALFAVPPNIPFAMTLFTLNVIAFSAVCALSAARAIRDRDVDD